MIRYTTTRRLLGAATLLTLAGCGGSAATGSATTSGGAGQAGTPSAAATVAVGAQNLLVAGSNHMTLYQFGQDAAGSGTSACTAACITRWPPLTIPAGSSASAGSIGGTWGTIVRSDGGGTQVTYNGRPLYFFSGDSKPGDTNGNYPGWSPVTVTAGAAAPTSAPSPTSTGGSTYGY